ncbi:ATP-binding protein [Streptomyces sp. NPDC046915]|uniref:ATP-binding protein n=1 Tax=Streptomyces sp. NPDC046915 TaxID=3155257 RepID=UPI0033D6F326
MPTGTTTPGYGPRELPCFTEQFASSPRGAQLARRLAVRRMGEWGYPPTSDASCAVALPAGLVRVEVADAASEKRLPAAPPLSCPDGESGRGLLLVDVLAVRWGSTPRLPLGKTVWAEVEIQASTSV